MKCESSSTSSGRLVEAGREEARFPVENAGQTISPQPLFRLKKILVPVDFSDCSKKALQYAIPFVRQFAAELILLHVAQRYLPSGELASLSTEFMQRELCDTGEKGLAALQQSLAADVPCKTVLRVGQAHTEIIDAARELEVDLIILSTHGRTGLAHVFLGSTAERIVRHARCPVLIVREREHEFVETPSAEAAMRE